MKIFDRIENILDLVKDYNYDNIIRRTDDHIWYFIPEIFVTDYGCYNWYTVDRNDKGGWVKGNFINKYLGWICNIDSQIYFDLLVLHINDTEDRPKCTRCNKPLLWSNRITSGYTSKFHKWTRSEKHFCSKTCSDRFKVEHPEQYPVLNSFLNEGGAFGMLHRNPDKYGLTGFNNGETWNKTCMSRFLKFGDPNDKCYFYIASTCEHKFKFGITQDPSIRYTYGYCLGNYINLKVIYSDIRYNIALLEYKVKKYMDFLHTEFLEFDHPNLYKFRIAYLKALNFIKSNNSSSTTIP